MFSVFELLVLFLQCDENVLSDELRQNQGGGSVDHKLVKAPQ